MKKILAILLVLLLLVGCGNIGTSNLSDDDAKMLFTKAMENSSINTNVDLSMNTESDDVKLKINVKIRNIDDLEKAQAVMNMESEEMVMAYYLDQGYLYMDMFGMKGKLKAEAEDFSEMFDVDQMVNSEFDLDSIDMDLLSFTKDSNTVTFTLKIDETMDEFGGGIGSIVIAINKKKESIASLLAEIEIDGSTTKVESNFEAKDKLEMPDFSDYIDMADIE